jgi:TATA-binding protein-associated factor Taf7
LYAAVKANKAKRISAINEEYDNGASCIEEASMLTEAIIEKIKPDEKIH